MPQIIQVQSLCKDFGEISAVDNLSFTVNEGDVYGFLGQNGAGKSTTIRMMLTLIQPTFGEIEIFGLKLNRHRREILRQTGAVIEKPDLYKYLTGYENMKIFSRLSGIHLSRVVLLERLHRVGLADRAFSKVHTYSQGMKQRLGIAVALVHDPLLIILDEPTNGLDPQGIADIRKLLSGLSRDFKKTVLVSSHLLGEVQQIANRMLIIDKGKKLVEGNVNELVDPEIVLLEIDTADNHDCYTKLAGSAWRNVLIRDGNGKACVRLSRNDLPRFNRELINMNIDVLSLRPQNSLEEYFLALTSGKE
jgi:ABC-type multidrug transport system ATPase subunit